VVLITTKRGKADQNVVRFNAYAGFSKIGKTLDGLNTQQYRVLMEEVLGPGSVDPSLTNYTNWNDEVFDTGKNQNYELSFAGGHDASRYFISGSYLKNDGIVNPASFDRYSLRLNLDNEVKSWLKVASSFNYLHAKSHNTQDNASSGRGGVIMSALHTPPFLNIYKNDGSGQFDPNPFQPSQGGRRQDLWKERDECVCGSLLGAAIKQPPHDHPKVQQIEQAADGLAQPSFGRVGRAHHRVVESGLDTDS
jgi:hypothetical protein